LHLSGNEITDAGARTLAGSPFLKRLCMLVLNSTGLTPEGVRELLASPNGANLQELGLNHIQLVEDDPGTTELLRARFGDKRGGYPPPVSQAIW
jgi:hypothetical protein